MNVHSDETLERRTLEQALQKAREQLAMEQRQHKAEVHWLGVTLSRERGARERLEEAVSDTRRDLEELATHDQCAGWPTEGGCHVAMQGIAARSLTRLDEALSATGREDPA